MGKYIESLDNTDCNKALIRIIPRINIEKIKKIIENSWYVLSVNIYVYTFYY